jgi:hypothetical protein
MTETGSKISTKQEQPATFEPTPGGGVRLAGSVASVLVGAAAVAALLTFAALNFVRDQAGEAGSTSVTAAKAQEILDSLLLSQPAGKAESAEFVETTMAEYIAAQSPESRVSSSDSGVRPEDRLILVKVVGTFPSAHSGPTAADTDASEIVVVYDERLQKTVERAFASAHAPGYAASGAPSAPFALATLGTPQPLHP